MKVGLLEEFCLGLLWIRVRGRILDGVNGGGYGVDYVCVWRLLVVPWREDVGEGG